ncbi:GNAT family N-acetyltransferase [Roseomonas sp. BN140053]|uniref:GNAT family N-acetyltransferase n=1 Tax=Roseomonas sp. BN140053 TaxID=3391898 RepID=UPI0039E73C29
MSAAACGLRAEVLRDDAALLALRPEWEALWRRCPAATPFQSPFWLLPWWAEFGTGQPRAAALRDGAGWLRGLLPLYLLPEGEETKLLPMGIGLSDYLDVLLEPEAPAEAASLLLRAALEASPEATTCDLTDLPPGAALREALAGAWQDAGLWNSDPCPVLELPAGATLGAVLSRKRHAALRNARNRAERAGGWAVESATANTLDPALDALIALHGARWEARGEPGGVLADPRVLRFHRAAAPGLLAVGVLRLQLLRLGGVPAAATYALLAPGGRVLLYLSGFDGARSYESPGAILLGAIVEEILATGGGELHLLRGDEAYKYGWGAADRHNAARHLVPPGRGMTA